MGMKPEWDAVQSGGRNNILLKKVMWRPYFLYTVYAAVMHYGDKTTSQLSQCSSHFASCLALLLHTCSAHCCRSYRWRKVYPLCMCVRTFLSDGKSKEISESFPRALMLYTCHAPVCSRRVYGTDAQHLSSVLCCPLFKSSFWSSWFELFVVVVGFGSTKIFT